MRAEWRRTVRRNRRPRQLKQLGPDLHRKHALVRQDVGDVVGGDLAHGAGVEEELARAAGAAAAAYAGACLGHRGLFPARLHGHLE